MHKDYRGSHPKFMLGKAGIGLNTRGASIEASERIEGTNVVETALTEHGQPMLTGRLRWCPAPGIERPTRPSYLICFPLTNKDIMV